MLVAVPLYSAAVARMSRAAFVPLVNRFFALNLVAFFAALGLLPESARAADAAPMGPGSIAAVRPALGG